MAYLALHIWLNTAFVKGKVMHTCSLLTQVENNAKFAITSAMNLLFKFGEMT